MQIPIIIILSILCIILFSIIIYNNKRNKKKYKQQYYEEIKLELQTVYEREKAKIDAEIDAARADAEEERANIRRTMEQNREIFAEMLQDARTQTLEAIEQHKASVDAVAAEYKKGQMEKIDTEIKFQYNEKVEQMNQALQAAQQQLTDSLGVQQKLLEDVTTEVNTMRATRDALNEEVLRRKEIEEHNEFYRVNLSEIEKADIDLLMSIKEKLHIHDKLDKLIYDVYVSKPVTEMIRRVLVGEEPSGIYKITRLKTGEIYIGKSTNVKKRWGEHCKTAFGVGTIAHSILHTTMKKDGIDSFTFELLEKVPKDKLTERETYWINFYNTKKYGMNERNG